ncbi:Response regulator receiver domain-containing protein [Actinopolymorpha cephalotaxi]|uniref:DNA-binding NarL/FixJ family response regulator n=1 Tax=Actinopolymorpha cephalotaxi TaxID=504797 RepID=A0A1I2K9Y7_9ACTN|nr:response regulator transcription factor [Actinopolymorpha cephalotaxi]NYH84331.1 DNA-binding NarL/FixJ family response regulator [Actinopolymorpha cephalotaxi]SFF63010.1 Response regulator receiver domain-containing protein [Actinopolymorpha cephalotaxi]
MRCLLIDDSPRYLRAARALLEREGVAVVGMAQTGEEALARVAELRPDVTLVDINLSGESGFDLARRLTSGQHHDGRPQVILISSHSADDFEDLIESSPAAGFLDKSNLSAAAIASLVGAD